MKVQCYGTDGLILTSGVWNIFIYIFLIPFFFIFILRLLFHANFWLLSIILFAIKETFYFILHPKVRILYHIHLGCKSVYLLTSNFS